MTLGRSLALGAMLFVTSMTGASASMAQQPKPAPPPQMPSIKGTEYTAAIDIEDGVRVSGKPAAVRRGSSSSTAAVGLVVDSSAPGLNGVLVKGPRSSFTLKNSAIMLRGPGSNDFLGIGAGAMVVGGSMTIDHSKITTNARVSSATVAADGAILKVYGSTLTANGGPLPPGYVRHIGPGMMEPPAPLGLSGTARTHLSMSNSKTYFHNSTIVADGWGALSTDATGGDLYLEADDSRVIVRGNGYGTYADFGAKVVLNRTSIDTGGVCGIIAGEASITFNRVTAKAARNCVMIHSVMGSPTEIGHLTITGGNLTSGGSFILIKSANADVLIDSARLSSTSGTIVEGRRNDDPNATKTGGKPVPGTNVTFRNSHIAGDIIQTDPDRTLTVVLDGSRLTGGINGAALVLGPRSRWTATKNSSVWMPGSFVSASIDARAGVNITVHGVRLPAPVKLPGGGTLVAIGQ